MRKALLVISIFFVRSSWKSLSVLGFRQALIPYRTVAINSKVWHISLHPIIVSEARRNYGTGQNQPYSISCSCVQRREITRWCDIIVHHEVVIQDQRDPKSHTKGDPSDECAEDVETEVGLADQS
jgi:hypothetical protein